MDLRNSFLSFSRHIQYQISNVFQFIIFKIYKAEGIISVFFFHSKLIFTGQPIYVLAASSILLLSVIVKLVKATKPNGNVCVRFIEYLYRDFGMRKIDGLFIYSNNGLKHR